MKKLTLAPYHLFQYHDPLTTDTHFYVFDIESSAVMRLDAPAYDVLALRLEGVTTETLEAHLASTYGVDTARAVHEELRWLEKRGIFQGPIMTYDADENEAYIQKLVRMSTNKIELYLAEACNLRCRYCYVNAHDALNHGLMPWEIAKQAIDLVFARAGNADSINITFFGGEPLLNKPVLKQVIAYSQELGQARGKRVGYSMTTNATLLDDEMIALIKYYNFGLMISMDGPQDVHDRMRPQANGQGSFELAARNVKRLMQSRRSVTVRCTLSNRCLDRPRIVQFLEDFGFSRVAMSRCTGTVDGLSPYDIGPEENVTLQAQDGYFIERLFEQLERGERIKYNPWANVVRHIHDMQSRRMRCGVGRGCTTVGIDGRLYPCHRYVGMDNYVLGHVSTGIDRAVFTDYLRGYFSTKRKCETCWAINLCGGYCPWYVSGADGSFPYPEDWWCDHIRHWYEMGIWMYDTLRNTYPDYFKQLVGDEDAEPILR
ncbi:MAG: radical SAM protein [Anaerolineae bacterium]|nr:radical SAM protein [Anaerolineae bacterium]